MVRYRRRLRRRGSCRRSGRELHARRGRGGRRVAISSGKLRAGLGDGYVGALPDLSIAAALVVAVAFALPPQGEHFAPQGGRRLMDRVHRDRLIDQFRGGGELRILNLFAGHQLARLPEPSLNLLLVAGALCPLLQVACVTVLRIQPQGLFACFERVFGT